jgi:hypothetical protein
MTEADWAEQERSASRRCGLLPDKIARLLQIHEHELAECFETKRKRCGLVSIERPKKLRAKERENATNLRFRGSPCDGVRIPNRGRGRESPALVGDWASILLTTAAELSEKPEGASGNREGGQSSAGNRSGHRSNAR